MCTLICEKISFIFRYPKYLGHLNSKTMNLHTLVKSFHCISKSSIHSSSLRISRTCIITERVILIRATHTARSEYFPQNPSTMSYNPSISAKIIAISSSLISWLTSSATQLVSSTVFDSLSERNHSTSSSTETALPLSSRGLGGFNQ